MIHKRAAWILLMLIVSATLLPALGTVESVPASASVAPVPGSYPVPLLLYFSWSGGLRDPGELEVLRNSVAAAFASRRPDARIMVQLDLPPDFRQATNESDAVGWIEVSVRETGPMLEISASAHAVAAVTPAFEVSYSEPTGTGFPNLGRIWTRAANLFNEAWPDLVDRALSDVRYSMVTVHAVPGTRLTGLGDGERIVPEGGVLRVEVASPLVYAVRARVRQHYPSETILVVPEDDVELVLDQPPRSAYSYDFALGGFSYPSVDVSRRIAGDYLYARTGLTTYLIGIVPLADDKTGDGGDRERVFYSENMTEFRAQLGSYLHSPYAPARLYLSSGAVWRLIHTRGFLGSDPLAPWGLVSIVGLESRPSERWRMFLEWQPALYRTEYPEALVRILPGAEHIWGPETSDAGIGGTPGAKASWVFAGGTIRVGVRWQP